MRLVFYEYFNQRKRVFNIFFLLVKGKEMQNHKEKCFLSLLSFVHTTTTKSGFAQTLKYNTNATVHKTLESWKMIPSDELWLIKLGVPCPSDMAARISPKNRYTYQKITSLKLVSGWDREKRQLSRMNHVWIESRSLLDQAWIKIKYIWIIFESIFRIYFNE